MTGHRVLLHTADGRDRLVEHQRAHVVMGCNRNIFILYLERYPVTKRHPEV